VSCRGGSRGLCDDCQRNWIRVVDVCLSARSSVWLVHRVAGDVKGEGERESIGGGARVESRISRENLSHVEMHVVDARLGSAQRGIRYRVGRDHVFTDLVTPIESPVAVAIGKLLIVSEGDSHALNGALWAGEVECQGEVAMRIIIHFVEDERSKVGARSIFAILAA